MSGKQFVATLKLIGYPGADSLDPSSVDWIFDNDDFQPFLQWFCDEVRPSNVLNPSERTEYQRLESSGNSVLEGEQLEQALQNLALFDKDVLELSNERLNEELVALSGELQSARLENELLMLQHNKLAMHLTALSDRVAKVGAVEDAKQLEYRKSLERNQLDNAKMNNSLESLAPAVNALSSMYRSSASGTEAQRQKESPLFLSHFDLEPYHRSEEHFTQALTAFTKKQFFEGIAEMAGQNDGSRYEFLEVSNPNLLFIRGEREDVNFDDCKELARIQTFYPLNVSKWINALAEECQIASACDFNEQMLSELKDQPFPNDIPLLSSRLKSAQTHLGVLGKDVGELAVSEIPALIKESASLQTAKLLCGDYNLKIARQNYFTGNQDKMIEYLMAQQARSEFISMALEVESRSHHDVQKLILAISLTLKQMCSAMEKRMKMMAEIEESSHQLNRTTVDSRDKFLNRLNQVLSQANSKVEGQQKKLFVTYEELGHNADKLMHQVEGSRASLRAANQREDDELASKESDLAKCESLLYPNNSRSDGLPVLSPLVLQETMSRLDGLLGQLEEAVMDIMKDVNNKKKSLQNDPLLATEREIFAYFYNDASRLRRVLEQINSRLQLTKNT